MPKSMKWWRKKWFYMRNNTDAPLPAFTGNHPIPNPTGVTGWPRRTSASCSLLWTFFNHQVQPLRQRVTKMWLYLGPSYLDRSFSEESSAEEINTQIHKVLDHGANPNPEVGSVPLREGVANTRDSLFGSVWQLMRFYPFITLMDLHSVSGVPVGCRGVSTCPRTQ
jgi:hypothetical protein